jgi:uncharacterized RDD family membrane protein YckC
MQDDNPYRSPTEECFVEPIRLEKPLPASGGRRFLNLLLDYVGFMALSFVIGLMIGLFTSVMGADREFLDKIPDLVYGLVVYLIYYIPQEALFGRTLGKLVTGTKVVSAMGERPTFGQIVGRTFCRMIPFEPFSFLFGGDCPVGWHDKISDTRVVRVRQSE